MKRFNITVNGQSYDVAVEEISGGAAPQTAAVPAAKPAPVPAAPAAPAAPAPAAPAPAAPAGGTSVVSPMPGNIMEVKVKVGQAVKNGETLIVLEAMKMENDIPAPKDGTVAAIFVNKGDTVDSNTPLVSLS